MTFVHESFLDTVANYVSLKNICKEKDIFAESQLLKNFPDEASLSISLFGILKAIVSYGSAA